MRAAGPRRAAAAASVAVACAAFLFCASRRLASPAPIYQEAYHVLPPLHLASGRSIHRDLWNSIRIGPAELFLSLNEYTGSWVETYSLLPLFAAGRTRVADWRTATLLLSLGAWLAFALLARDLFGVRAGVLALVMLCFQSSLFFYARTGLDSESAALWLLSSLFWLCAGRWASGGRAAWARGAAFILGLGVYEKIEFLWIFASFALAYAVVYRAEARRRLPPASCAAFLAAGLLPLALVNVVNPWCTVLFVVRGILHPVQGTGNLHFAAHLGVRLRQFYGYALTEEALARPFSAWVLAAKAAPLAACAAACAPKVARRLPRFAFVLPASVPFYLAVSCVHGTGLGSYHLLVALPPYLVFAAGAIDAVLPSWPAFLAASGLAVLPDVVAWRSYSADFEASGGQGTQSLALYDLSDYCVSHGLREPVSLRAGSVETLEAVSGGRVVPIDSARPALRLQDDWRSWLGDPAVRFIAPNPEFFETPTFARELDFEAWARSRGYALAVERTFPNREGTTMYSICVLKKLAAAAKAAPN